MVPGFWQWYYGRGIKNIIAVYQSVLLLTYDYFSISFLLRTLFAPWKKDVVNPQTPSLQLIIQAFWFNLIVRIVGAFVRISVIFAGVISLALVALLGALVVFGATVLPATIILLGFCALLLLSNGDILMIISGAGLILIAGVAPFLAFRAWQADKWRTPLPEKKLKDVELNKENISYWFDRKTQVFVGSLGSSANIKQALFSTRQTQFILVRLGIGSDSFLENQFDQNIAIEDIMLKAGEFAQIEESQLIKIGHVTGAVFALDKSLEKVMVDHDIVIEDVLNVVSWQERIWNELDAPSELINPSKLRFTGGVGRDWASGYTNYLDKFANDVTDIVTSPHFDHQFIAHKNQIDEVERILSRSGKHNVLLIGETGIGKRTMVLGFARRLVMGDTLMPLRHKRLVELDVSSILANASSSGVLEARLIGLLNEAVKAGNVILYIDDIERLLLNNDNKAGSVNAGEILLPYLQSSVFQLIGTISPADYHMAIERQMAIASSFEKIEISEPDEKTTIRIMQEVAPSMEMRHGVVATYQALRQIVVRASRYLPQRKFPEKGIDILDEVAVDVATKSKSKLITPEAVDALLSQKTNMPIGEAKEEEKESLLNLEQSLHERVINQTNAIEAISNALRRSRAGVKTEGKPVGTFLFLGPTGVGKTETAKALAEIYFKSEKEMLRIDMSEYQEISSLRRLIGDETQGLGGALTNGIREKPFTVVLLDEIEKAHPKILDIFLQVLDEGRLTDALGQVADFRNAIIIATSNAGANFIRQSIEANIQNFDMNAITKELLNQIQNDNIFRPEFLNRFDSVIAFRPLTIEELEKVVDLQLNALNKRLSNRQITVKLSEGARSKLAKLGFDPTYGARALTRAMSNSLENLLAQKLLKEEIQKGQIFEVSEEMIQ